MVKLKFTISVKADRWKVDYLVIQRRRLPSEAPLTTWHPNCLAKIRKSLLIKVPFGLGGTSDWRSVADVHDNVLLTIATQMPFDRVPYGNVSTNIETLALIVRGGFTPDLDVTEVEESIRLLLEVASGEHARKLVLFGK